MICRHMMCIFIYCIIVAIAYLDMIRWGCVDIQNVDGHKSWYLPLLDNPNHIAYWLSFSRFREYRVITYEYHLHVRHDYI